MAADSDLFMKYTSQAIEGDGMLLFENFELKIGNTDLGVVAVEAIPGTGADFEFNADTREFRCVSGCHYLRYQMLVYSRLVCVCVTHAFFSLNHPCRYVMEGNKVVVSGPESAKVKYLLSQDPIEVYKDVVPDRITILQVEDGKEPDTYFRAGQRQSFFIKNLKMRPINDDEGVRVGLMPYETAALVWFNNCTMGVIITPEDPAYENWRALYGNPV